MKRFIVIPTFGIRLVLAAAAKTRRRNTRLIVRSFLPWCLIVLIGIGSNVRGQTPADTLRAWRVEDSVGIRYFVSDPTQTYFAGWLGGDENLIVISPDSEHFFFVFHHGDLASDRVVYELAVYAVKDVKAAFAHADSTAEPVRRITLSAASAKLGSSSGMNFPRWKGNDAIEFLFNEGTLPTRVYRYEINTDTLKPLTDEKHDVAGLLYATGGGSIVFIATDPNPPKPKPKPEYPFARITDAELKSQLFDVRWSQEGGVFNASYRGGVARPVTPHFSERSLSFRPWVSPDGKWAIAVYVGEALLVPKGWKNYENSACRLDYRFMLIDIEHGGVRPVFDAPAGEIPAKVVPGSSGCHAYIGFGQPPLFDAFWSADSRHVILLNTSLPLGENQDERQRLSYVADYDLEADRYSVLEPMANTKGVKVWEGSWFDEGKELLITHRTASGDAAAGVVYKLKDGRWIGQAAPKEMNKTPELKLPFSVTLNESANDPPVMVASDGKHSVTLTRPDPALEGVWRARAETVEWQEPGNKTAKGLLMLPRNYFKATRLPLVIQGFSYKPQLFRPDGVTLSAFAAQALVAQGFAVLQIDFAYDDQSTFQTPQEVAARVARIDAAVGMLATKGIVDAARVGLVGFSRSGYSSYYVITHPGRVKVAAAVIFDSITMGYGDYLNFRAYGGAKIFEKQYGGSFWKNKKAWLEEAPEFNVDQIQTPVLFSKTGGASLWAVMATVSAFTYCRRPFEYLDYPQGQHQLERPRERVASMQATVDWMNFWLQSKEDPDPAKAEKYARWRKMKADWEQVQKEEAAAKQKGVSSKQ